MPDVSVIIVNWNTEKLLAEAIESVYSNADSYDVEIVVVDNHSSDGSLAMLARRFQQVRVIANAENSGFARANNQGVQAANGAFVLLLNSDAQLTPGSLWALMELAKEQPKAGLVGARLINPDGSFQAAHTPIPTLRQEFLILSGLGRLFFGPRYPSRGEKDQAPSQVGYVEGACMLCPRSAYLKVGGLDEGYFMYAEDVDLCYAMQLSGRQVWYQPAAQVIHVGSASSKHRKPQREADLYRSRVRFFRKYYGDGAANFLIGMIYFFTAVKGIAHGILHGVSGGRWGRQVVSLRTLTDALKNA